MDRWNYNLDDSRNFEHPNFMQYDKFNSDLQQATMLPQPYPQDQCPESSLSFLEEMAAQLQMSLTDDVEQWRESQERSLKFDQLLEQIQIDRLFEQDQ